MQLTADLIYLVSSPHIRGLFFEVIVITIIKIIPDDNVKQVLAAALPVPVLWVIVSCSTGCDGLMCPPLPGKGSQERSSPGALEEQRPSQAIPGIDEAGAR